MYSVQFGLSQLLLRLLWWRNCYLSTHIPVSLWLAIGYHLLTTRQLPCGPSLCLVATRGIMVVLSNGGLGVHFSVNVGFLINPFIMSLLYHMNVRVRRPHIAIKWIGRELLILSTLQMYWISSSRITVLVRDSLAYFVLISGQWKEN